MRRQYLVHKRGGAAGCGGELCLGAMWPEGGTGDRTSCQCVPMEQGFSRAAPVANSECRQKVELEVTRAGMVSAEHHTSLDLVMVTSHVELGRCRELGRRGSTRGSLRLGCYRN